MSEPTRAAERLAARLRGRERAAAQAEAMAEHECTGDRRGWCGHCLLADAIAWQREHGGRFERGRSKTTFSPFTIMRDLEGRRR